MNLCLGEDRISATTRTTSWRPTKQKPRKKPPAKQSISCTKSPRSSYASPLPSQLNQINKPGEPLIATLTAIQNTDLDRQSLSYCVSLIENGVNPEALAVSLPLSTTSLLCSAVPFCDRTDGIAESHQRATDKAGESGSTIWGVRFASLLVRSYLFF
jgi:hypothetical protein